jgi:plastocyanin
MRRRHVLILSTFLFASGCGSDGGGTTNPPGTGIISGEVTGQGGAIPGAQVALTGGASQMTTSEGKFTFNNVTAGAHTVTVTPPTGFQLDPGETAARSATVTAGGTVNVNWGLRLTDTTPRTVGVGLNATTFSSSDVTIPVGSTIEWTNLTAITHTISPNQPGKAGTWPEQNISGQGTTFDFTFGTAGTFDYICKLHAGMDGVIRVH